MRDTPFYQQGDRELAVISSNIGKLRLPDALAPFVKGFGVYMSTNALQLCTCSFGSSLHMDFTSALESTEVQRRFFAFLVSDGVDVEIRMGNIEDVFRWVSEDKMDLGFASRQEGMTLEWVRLRDDPLLAILPPDYDLDGRHSFPVEGFSGEEFLMPSLGFHQDILRVMRGGGAEPVYRSPQVSDNVIISMVEHGLGLSILSELVLRGRQDDVLAVPLDPPAVREIGVAMRSRKEMPLMVRRFLNEARDMIETL